MNKAGERPPPSDQHGRGRRIGRFEMFGTIASGGFAAIHMGRTMSAGGFSKLVAIKRLHRQFVEDPEIREMFLDEARVVARIQHPNVVPTLDFIEEDGELFMAMEYVEGATLGHMLHETGKKKQRIPLDITLRIMTGALRGLHAAHEARDEQGKALCVIHRDVSPENILVGTDGYSRILDFGVARAMGRYHATRAGEVKGKMFYMTPEQVMGEPLTRRADIFSLSVVFWECLTTRRLFDGEHMGELAHKVTQQAIATPSVFYRTLPRKYETIVMRGLERDPSLRWATAEDMAEAIEEVGKLASVGRVAKWVKSVAQSRLEERAEKVGAMELTPTGVGGPESQRGSTGEDSYRATSTQVLRTGERAKETESTTVIVSGALATAPEAAPAHVSSELSKPGTLSAPISSSSGPRLAPSQPGTAPAAPAPSAPGSTDPMLAAAVPSEPAVSPPSSEPAVPSSQQGMQPFPPAKSDPGNERTAKPSWPRSDDPADDEVTVQIDMGDDEELDTLQSAVPEPATTAQPSAPTADPVSEPEAPAAVPSEPQAAPLAPPDMYDDGELSMPTPSGRGRKLAIFGGIGVAAAAAIGYLVIQPADKPAPTSDTPAAASAPAPTPPAPTTEPAAEPAAPEPEPEPADDTAEPEVEEPPEPEPAPKPVAKAAPKLVAKAAPKPRPVAARPKPRPVPRRPAPRPRPKPKPKSEDSLFSRD